MFWNRAAREARRQKVLDELIELTPQERRSRMDQAVVEGDVRAGEVEQVLRLVGRLDALRVMTIPGARNAAPATGVTTDGPPEPVSVEAVAKPPSGADSRVPVEVGAESVEVPVSQAGASRQGRAIGREASVRKAGRAIGGSPRRRRLRLAASARQRALARAGASGEMAAAPDVQYAVAAAAEAKQEEQWPDISWLRPE